MDADNLDLSRLQFPSMDMPALKPLLLEEPVKPKPGSYYRVKRADGSEYETPRFARLEDPSDRVLCLIRRAEGKEDEIEYPKIVTEDGVMFSDAFAHRDRYTEKLKATHTVVTEEPRDGRLPYVGELLRKSADLFDERNAVYGSNFEMVGKLMEAMFPNGITLKTAEDHNRFHLFMLKIVKLSRYAVNYEAGGHVDSLDDDIVYTAMVAAMDKRAGHR